MLTINNVKIKGISSTVPSNEVNNTDFVQFYGEKETLKLIDSIGVKHRFITSDEIKSSDLCFDAANRLIDTLAWDRNEIGAVIFVSQTPDYQLPATACILQNKLGLSNHTLAFDINMGCSGYIYGLQVASSLVSNGIKKVLLLVGDTISKLIKKGDRSTELLFGDAGSATAIEYDEKNTITFELGSDGSGWENIVARQQIVSPTLNGNNYAYLEMNGSEVFSFTLSRVPKLVNQFLNNLNIMAEEIDLAVYHQANLFMLKHLFKKSKLTPVQTPISIDYYGNTSCASIPLTLCHHGKKEKSNKILLVGFGVGLSWGAAICDLSDTVILPIKVMNNDK
ncbi:TPA: ketoacyl-ACP synthase III [Providencia alcalifaciens]